MKHNTSSNLPEAMTETLERCQDSIKESFEEGAWTSFAQASKSIGVHFTTLHNWQKEGKIPSQKQGTRRWMRASHIEEIRAAFEAHGSKWFDYVSDEFKSHLAEEVETPEESSAEEPQSISEQWVQLTLENAKAAHAAGKFEASSHLFMLFMDAAEKNMVNL